MRFVLKTLLISVVTVSFSFAEDDPDARDIYGRTFEDLTSNLTEYEFTAEVSKFDAKLRSTPVLRWTNPVRRTIESGVFLWTDRGRPIALMSAFWSGQRNFQHEFQSLADFRFSMRLGDKRWTPDAATKYEVFDKDIQVSAKRSLRLIQMRGMAKSIDAFVFQSKSEEKLRLLPEPLYRYPEVMLAEGVIDGGLFAFVQATDPEVLMVLEAREDDDGNRMWYAGYGRMSAYPLTVRRNNATVREWKYDSGGRTNGYTVLTYDFVAPQL